MPKRYIESTEAIRVLSEYYHQTDLQKYVLAEAISRVPTADVVEVVRCKDCVHYNAGFECLKEGYGIEYPTDYYCADGERKDGGAE